MDVCSIIFSWKYICHIADFLKSVCRAHINYDLIYMSRCMFLYMTLCTESWKDVLKMKAIIISLSCYFQCLSFSALYLFYMSSQRNCSVVCKINIHQTRFQHLSQYSVHEARERDEEENTCRSNVSLETLSKDQMQRNGFPTHCHTKKWSYQTSAQLSFEECL